MQNLLKKIHKHFDALDNEKKCFTVFAKHNVMLEGWFKGELLCLFNSLPGVTCVCEKNFPASSAQGKRALRVDFSIIRKGVENLVELKAVAIPAEAAHARKRLAFYFGKDYLPKDAGKLRTLSAAQKWLLAFIYPGLSDPDKDEWQALVTKHGLENPDNALVHSENYSIALIKIP